VSYFARHILLYMLSPVGGGEGTSKLAEEGFFGGLTLISFRAAVSADSFSLTAVGLLPVLAGHIVMQHGMRNRWRYRAAGCDLARMCML
jgi:hypothetical protein